MTGWILRSQDEPAQVFRLAPNSVKTIGRTVQTDFILDAPLVSRVHCRLTADQSDQLVVEDLGSTNGTIVNGRHVDRSVLRPGDTLLIGRVTFLVLRED